MKFFERVTLVLLGISIILMLLKQNEGVLVFLSATITGIIIYFPLGFLTLYYDGLPKIYKVYGLITGIIFASLIIGIYMRTMILRGGEAWQIIFSPLWLLVCIFIVFKRYKNPNNIFYRSITFKFVLLLFINIFLYLLPVEILIDKIHSTNNINSQRMKDYYNKIIKEDGDY